MAPSLIRSACRKSPSEGGAEEVVLIVCRHCTALLSPNDGHSSCHRSRARFYIVTSRSFSFSVEFASLVNLDIYCFSLSFFPCCISKVGCGSDLSRRIHEEIALRQMAHTLLLVSFIGCSLVAFTWKVLPLGFQRGPLKMVSNVFCTEKCICFFAPFLTFLHLPLISLLLRAQDLSLYMNLSTFIVKTL